MKKMLTLTVCLAVTFAFANGTNAATITALSTFGGGDGWIAPGQTLKLGTGNLERGMAYNPQTGNILFVSRDGGVFIEVLNGTTGVKVGNLNVTGVTGGSLGAANMIAAAADGAIYVGNWVSNASLSPYKIYRWSDESAAPTVAYSGALAAVRLGDTLDVIGSGINTRLIAGHNTAGFNNFSIFATVDGQNFTGNPVAIPGPPTPPANAFHLGITFTDNDTVIGRGNGNVTSVVDVDPSLASATSIATNSLAPGSTLRPMDYTVLGNGLPIWAVLQSAGTSTTPGANSRVFVYDMTDPNNPVEIAQGNTTLLAPANANGNGTGQVKFGETTYRKAVIYALDTNNGIQAFELTTVPEPSCLALAGLCCCLVGLRRRQRRV